MANEKLNGNASAVTASEEEFDPGEDSAYRASTNELNKAYRYAWALPYFDHTLKLPPLQPFEHVDPASRALNDPDPKAFLKNAVKVEDVTPYLGTVVEGLQLNKLSDKDRDQLALFVARRRVVVSHLAKYLETLDLDAVYP